MAKCETFSKAAREAHVAANDSHVVDITDQFIGNVLINHSREEILHLKSTIILGLCRRALLEALHRK
jgi:hypothetical protein